MTPRHPRALDIANAVCLDEVARKHETYPSTSRLLADIECTERKRVVQSVITQLAPTHLINGKPFASLEHLIDLLLNAPNQKAEEP